MIDPPDDLADVLAPRPGQPSPELRERLFRATERRLARDRWLRRGTRATAVAAVFLLGGFAGWLVRPERERVIEVAGDAVAVPVVVPIVLNPDVPATGSTGTQLVAAQAELRAEQADDRAEAAKLYRQAGDAFLRDQDYANATRCYRLYLARGGDTALSLATDDSWLLISLKNAAFKEKAHVPKTDG
jgi:hypothetical protein